MPVKKALLRAREINGVFPDGSVLKRTWPRGSSHLCTIATQERLFYTKIQSSIPTYGTKDCYFRGTTQIDWKFSIHLKNRYVIVRAVLLARLLSSAGSEVLFLKRLIVAFHQPRLSVDKWTFNTSLRHCHYCAFYHSYKLFVNKFILVYRIFLKLYYTLIYCTRAIRSRLPTF